MRSEAVVRGRSILARGFSSLALLGALLLVGCPESTPVEAGVIDTGRGNKLGVFDEVGDFEFTDQKGQPFSRADLEGKVWVVSLIFTNCPSICRDLTELMRILAYHYRDEPEVGFLSFSIEPEVDTPEVLDRYASIFKADPERWHFLTGDKELIYGFARKSLLAHIGEKDETGDIGHKFMFWVLDQKGRLRSFPSKTYGETGTDLVASARHDVDLLLKGDAE